MVNHFTSTRRLLVQAGTACAVALLLTACCGLPQSVAGWHRWNGEDHRLVDGQDKVVVETFWSRATGKSPLIFVDSDEDGKIDKAIDTRKPGISIWWDLNRDGYFDVVQHKTHVHASLHTARRVHCRVPDTE